MRYEEIQNLLLKDTYIALDRCSSCQFEITPLLEEYFFDRLEMVQTLLEGLYDGNQL